LGKTTLANQVFKEMAELPQFQSTSKYIALQTEQAHDGKFNADVITKLHRWLQEHCAVPVLVLLDNVQSEWQLARVLPDCGLAHGSFVVITSLMTNLGVHVYEMPFMNDKHAVKLFRYYSQGSAHAGALTTAAWQNLELKMLQACAGLPLALELAGRLGFTRHQSVWKVCNNRTTCCLSQHSELTWCMFVLPDCACVHYRMC
jgi:NB-ARC domain